MKLDRPKLKVPYEQIDIVIELVNITLLILVWVYTFLNYTELPDTIPIHFNGSGEVDDYGNKVTIWILPAIATFTAVLLFVINKFPHIHNYMVNITEENALKNYRISTRLIRSINLYCLVLFAAIIIEIISVAKGKPVHILNTWFLIFSIVVPLCIVGFAFYFQNKINK